MADNSSPSKTWYIALLVINTILYAVCVLMIIKRRKYSCISIRSPLLLLCNNIGGFMMTTVMIVNQIIEDKNKFYIPSLFFIFQTLMMISFFLRCHRIVKCCQIKSDERSDKQQFYNKRYIFQEKYYIKLMIVALALVIIVFLIVDLVYKYPFTINFLIFNGFSVSQANVWIILNVIEQMIMITYGYFMRQNEVKQKIQFELLAFFICWFLFGNLYTFYDYFYFLRFELKYNKEIQFGLGLMFLYLCLFLNGYFPVILSFCYHTSISYHFSPQLMNNLYLFLSNEDCYGAFSDYLKSTKIQNDVFYLRLYTHIMKFKLEFISDENNQTIVDEAREIMGTYFNNQDYGDQEFVEVVNQIKSNNINLNSQRIESEIFDEALKYSYMYLGKKFVQFKKTQDYQNLTDKLTLQSYIQCKMCNTGLINKF